MKRTLLSLILTALAAPMLQAEKIDSIFICVPTHVLQLLDKNAKMDIIDLYNFKANATVENRFEGRTTLKEKTPTHIKLQLTDVSTWELRMHVKRRDTIYECIHTLTKPIERADTAFYSTDWKKI